MVHFTGAKQRNKDHKRRVDELLKCRQERFDLCCIHIVSLVINHHRSEGVMSFPAVERAKGSNQCKQILNHGYHAGENPLGASKHGHGKI